MSSVGIDQHQKRAGSLTSSSIKSAKFKMLVQCKGIATGEIAQTTILLQVSADDSLLQLLLSGKTG
ncbi:MAG: hypothetical protein ACE5GZ_01085 [Gammaproteobacteria bacterium]